MTKQQEKAIAEVIIYEITSGISKTEFDSTPIKVEDLDLNRIDVIGSSRVNVINFRSKGDIRIIEGEPIQINFGNMVNGFDFSIPTLSIPNIWKCSENLYIAGIYSNNNPLHLAAQEILFNSNNGLRSKRTMRYQDNEFTQNVREDWEEFNVEWMKYVVWCKICTNENFRNLLLSTPDNSLIVEDTSFQKGEKRKIWGAENLELKRIKLEKLKELKARLNVYDIPVSKKHKQLLFNQIYGVSEFTGENKMGKILTYFRIFLRTPVELVKPDIDYDLLNSKNIFILGQKLVFE